MATNLTSSAVSAGDDATAVQYNNLRKDVVKNAGDFEVTAGTSNAYTLAIDSSITTYVEGDKYRMQIDRNNTGSATLNVNTIGAKTLTKPVNTVLSADDLVADMIIEVVYNADNDTLDIVAGLPGGSSGASAINFIDFFSSSDWPITSKFEYAVANNLAIYGVPQSTLQLHKYAIGTDNSLFPINNGSVTYFKAHPTATTTAGIAMAQAATDYVYIFALDSATWKVIRYDISGDSFSDMTVSGTSFDNDAANRIAFDSNGDLFVADLDTTKVRKYTISGTTMTYDSDITLANAPQSGGTSFSIGPDDDFIYKSAVRTMHRDNSSGTNQANVYFGDNEVYITNITIIKGQWYAWFLAETGSGQVTAQIAPFSWPD